VTANPLESRCDGAVREILRLAASIKQGTVMASLMLRKLGSYPRRNARVKSRKVTLHGIEDAGNSGSRQQTVNRKIATKRKTLVKN
jgi:hypothetical protein